MNVMKTAPDDEQSRLGIVPGEDGEGWMGPFDCAGATATTETIDGWIRETPEGIEMTRHPEAALRDDPALWDFMARWSAGVWREALSVDDLERLSNFEVDLLLTAQAAHEREVNRRVKKLGAED